MRTTPLKVYIHLPKCGGTTVDANLNAHLGPRFFQYVNRSDWPTLQRHAATGFRDIDVITVHNARFPYERMLTNIEAEYIAVCREPISAALSMYNFAITATHTQNYDRVKELTFWQFMALSHRIPIWSPNFQCYYLSGERNWEAAEAFLHRFGVTLYTLSELDDAYRRLTGQPLAPSLDRNKSSKTVMRADLSEMECGILEELFDIDAQLWNRAQQSAAARGALDTVKTT
ncbi:hypothetical protein [Phaeobacter sp. HF9A]|uniref:hypothetical protein n=1 Tax=Phaeobacter sp. HF9A TaxID=2721561 RepID=UPI00142F699E|nr:hypothetical protein [Phaeobacter sp. HF9A]NIZ13224.1 hypothetical protein [Phaeobacter sp. HF9A]